jgi:hypothetical protein
VDVHYGTIWHCVRNRDGVDYHHHNPRDRAHYRQTLFRFLGVTTMDEQWQYLLVIFSIFVAVQLAYVIYLALSSIRYAVIMLLIMIGINGAMVLMVLASKPVRVITACTPKAITTYVRQMDMIQQAIIVETTNLRGNSSVIWDNMQRIAIPSGCDAATQAIIDGMRTSLERDDYITYDEYKQRLGEQ